MEKHPQITLKRIRRALEELQQRLWIDQRPVQVSMYQTPEPDSVYNGDPTTVYPGARSIVPGVHPVDAWFHVEGDYPAAWTGSTVALLMDTSSEALVWVDGAPAQGLDANRNDFIITESSELCGKGGPFHRGRRQ